MSEAPTPGPNGNEPFDDAVRALDSPFNEHQMPAPEGAKRSRRAHRRYFLWMHLSRLALGAFIFLGAILAIWLVPWSPTGLNAAKFTPQVAFTIYLLVGITLIGLLVLALREMARRERLALSAWATVYDEATGLHTRAYFYDRLNLECERGQQAPEPFSVIVLQFHGMIHQTGSKNKPPLSDSALEKIAELINSATHPTDLVGMLSGSELAVLAIRIDRGRRHALEERLRKTVSTVLPDLVEQPGLIDVRSGGATFGVDGTQAGGLIQAARTNAALGVRQRIKAIS